MAESNGLLDFAQSPMAMGLLAAAAGGLAGARRGTPINNLGRAGLAGLAGYSAADSYQQKKRELDKAAAIQAAIPSLYGEDGSFDVKGGAALGIKPADLKGYAEAPNAGRAKVGRTVQVPGVDGRPVTIQLDVYGNKVGEGLDAYVAPQLVDTGDKKQFVTPQAGQSFGVNLSPAQILADQNSKINQGLRAQANAIAGDANNINKEAQRTQIVAGADGVNYLVDKGTATARPAMTAAGAPVVSGRAAEDARSRERDANDAVELLSLVDKALPGATGSGVGASADAAGRYFGLTSEGGKKAAQLEALGGALVMKMPRMEGPQSNLDQLLYREMAGKIGDRTVPVEERAAARKIVGELLTKYATNNPQAGQQPQASQAQPAQRAVVRTGMMNGRKVVQYADGSTEYAD